MRKQKRILPVIHQQTTQRTDNMGKLVLTLMNQLNSERDSETMTNQIVHSLNIYPRLRISKSEWRKF